MDINFPADIVVLEKLKDSLVRQRLAAAGRQRINMARGSRSVQVHAIRMRSAQYGGEPGIGSGEARGHEIVIVELVAIEITHRAVPEDIVQPKAARVSCSCVHEAVHGSESPVHRIRPVAVNVALVP